jgi:meso-butanediol dehydrogenase / (S,S)-butanediol dehydrogenase / diacetyl reductase
LTLFVRIHTIGLMTTDGRPVVLITGAGSGIGAALARRLGRAGHHVVICGRRPESLESVAGDSGARPIVCDISDAAAVARMFAETIEAFGRLDGLVLNAGIIASGGVGDLPVEAWHAMLATNLTGAFLCARAALPHLLASRGAIVAVASEAALRASSGMSGYSATKAGLTMLTQSMAVDYGPEGLRANIVCPGWTVTEMADAEMAEFGSERDLGVQDAYQLVTSLVPQRRPAGADEIAAVIAWLLSDEASFVNGAVIPADGGAVAVDAGTVPFDPRVSMSGFSQVG